MENITVSETQYHEKSVEKCKNVTENICTEKCEQYIKLECENVIKEECTTVDKQICTNATKIIDKPINCIEKSKKVCDYQTPESRTPIPDSCRTISYEEDCDVDKNVEVEIVETFCEIVPRKFCRLVVINPCGKNKKIIDVCEPACSNETQIQCKTVKQKVPIKVQKTISKKNCDKSHENHIKQNEEVLLPCWSGKNCPSFLIRTFIPFPQTFWPGLQII